MAYRRSIGRTERIAQLLRLEVVKHKQNLFRRTTLECRHDGTHLMGEKRDKDEIVRDGLLKGVGDTDVSALPRGFDDGQIVSQLLESRRAWTGDRGDVVSANASQLEGEGTADCADTDDCDPQIRGGVELGFAAHATMIEPYEASGVARSKYFCPI